MLPIQSGVLFNSHNNSYNTFIYNGAAISVKKLWFTFECWRFWGCSL